ncbi:stage II sporulation protein P [Natribacillus halophilus]|uniref:Stage II sporulation protein P n=1 Tax=Natribacillus halophilus TaxID=549003 RepID=A0A1G8JTL7_9BACI|nr:stage II sporulation protein P [Natribacillus halophilus]SDI34538.1 stage II sporulation protein P [Natribacillus halophilus]
MRRPKSQAGVYSLSKAKVQSTVMGLIAFIVMTFLIIAMLTTAENHSRFASSALNDWTAQMQSDWFVHLLGAENRYYLDAMHDPSPPSLTTAAFEIATNMNLEDPRTFLGREIPGFSGFDDTLVIAGQGTDFTNMSIESGPPAEEHLDELPETDEEASDAVEDDPPEIDDEEPIIHLLHSHSRESFLPEIEGGDPNHPETNIVQVGQYFADQLREHGLPVEVSEHDIQAKLNERDWDYSQSYDMSREILVEDMEENDELAFFFDLHRDSVAREHTTATINDDVYARTFFVIGEDHPDYEQNLAMAEDLHNRLEEQWPGLSRGVITRGGAGVNGVYNQDLSPNAMLIEFGGVDNTFEEVYRSADAMAEVLQEYIHEEMEEEE